MRNPSSTPSTSRTMKTTNQTTTPCCVKIGLKKGPWTPEEDEKLENFLKKEGEGRWRTLPKRAGLLRCGKSCRLRWMNYLRPNVKRGKITPDEEDLILRLHRLLGNRWSMIAGRIPGRTDNEIKNYWNTHLSKKLISQGIDPRTHKPLVSFDPNTNNNDDDPHPSSPKHNNIPISQDSNPNPNPSPNIALDETIVNENHNNHGVLDDTNAVDDQDSEAHTNGMSNGDENNMNYCTDDGVFSSFLNDFINEDVFFSQHQPLQQVNHQSRNGDIEPLFATSDPLISYAQAFGLNTGNWETTMLPGFNLGNDPRKFDEDHV